MAGTYKDRPDPNKKKKSVTIYLSTENWNFLDAYARENRRSIGSQVALFLEESILAESKKETKRSSDIKIVAENKTDYETG